MIDQMQRLLALNNYDSLSQNLTPTHPAPKQCLSYRHTGSLLFKDLLKPEINLTNSHLSKDGYFRKVSEDASEKTILLFIGKHFIMLFSYSDVGHL